MGRACDWFLSFQRPLLCPPPPPLGFFDPFRTERAGKEEREGSKGVLPETHDFWDRPHTLWVWETSARSFLGSLETLYLRSPPLLLPAPPNRLNAFLLWLVACLILGSALTFSSAVCLSLRDPLLESSSDDPMPVSLSQSPTAGPLEAFGSFLPPASQGSSCSVFALQPGPPASP